MAGMGENIKTNGGDLNIPDEDAIEPATTIAGLELILVTSGGEALETGAVFFPIAMMIGGSEFLNMWAMAGAISFERGHSHIHIV